jgi:hypothetical protein
MESGDVRSEVLEFYRSYNPEKLDMVDEILDQWKGRERLLLDALKDKYGVGTPLGEVTNGMGATADIDMFQSTPNIESRNPFEQAALREYQSKVVSFYRQYNPSKLNEVDSIMEKWTGRENLLIQALEKKYQGVRKESEQPDSAPRQSPEPMSPMSPSRTPLRRQSTAFRRSNSTPPTSRSPKKSLRRGVSSTLQAARAARGESIDTSRDAEPRKGPDTDLLRTLVTMQSAELRRIRSELNEAYGALRNLQQQQQQQAAP